MSKNRFYSLKDLMIAKYSTKGATYKPTPDNLEALQLFADANCPLDDKVIVEMCFLEKCQYLKNLITQMQFIQQ